jgi:hypothetical protein
MNLGRDPPSNPPGPMPNNRGDKNKEDLPWTHIDKVTFQSWRQKSAQGRRRVQGEPILARGEVTGHTHRIVEGQVRLYQVAAGIMYLRVLSEFAKLYHEEHEDIVLPKGDYEVRQQREFDLLGGRRGRCAMPWTKRGAERIASLPRRRKPSFRGSWINGTGSQHQPSRWTSIAL